MPSHIHFWKSPWLMFMNVALAVFKMQKFRNTIGGGRRPPDFGSPDSKKNAFCYARSRLLKTWMGAPIPLCCEACLKGMQHHWLDLGPILEPKATKIVLPLLQRFGQANRFGIPIKISILFTSLCRQFMTFFSIIHSRGFTFKNSKKVPFIFGAKIQTSFFTNEKNWGKYGSNQLLLTLLTARPIKCTCS